MMKTATPGMLVLADGTCFEGVSIAEKGYTCGEVVFNTAQTGYQEVLTDPSYAEQLVTFTHPHIGNTGINKKDMESHQIYLKGIITRNISEYTYHPQSHLTLHAYLKKNKVIALTDIDTRALTHHLRKFGSQSGCIMTGTINYQNALQHAKNFGGLFNKDLTKIVTTKEKYLHHPTLQNKKNNMPHIIVYDFGVKKSILDSLAQLKLSVTVVPAETSAEAVLALQPHGIILSNGPGDPTACHTAIKNIKNLLQYKIPLMAICLGHQLLALASGAKIQKMIFGHHGINHPILNIEKKYVSLSSQNHGYVVAEKNLPSCLKITHRSLFDHTIAGIERTDTPAFGFQGHPEGGPGPTELITLFMQFKHMIKKNSLFGATYAKKN